MRLRKKVRRDTAERDTPGHAGRDTRGFWRRGLPGSMVRTTRKRGCKLRFTVMFDGRVREFFEGMERKLLPPHETASLRLERVGAFLSQLSFQPVLPFQRVLLLTFSSTNDCLKIVWQLRFRFQQNLDNCPTIHDRELRVTRFTPRT